MLASVVPLEAGGELSPQIKLFKQPLVEDDGSASVFEAGEND